MATQTKVHYPTRDGKPIGETPKHRDLLIDLVRAFQRWFEDDPMTYTSGNMMMYYVEGDKHKHLSPDVFVTRGIPDDGPRRGLPLREAYFVWEEGKGPDLVIELTSKSTRRVDQTTKFTLYRDTLKVPEYFLFDPLGDYLKPRLQGYRLVEGRYDPIEPLEGRLPSLVTGLYLEADEDDLRLFDPNTRRWIETVEESLAQTAEAARRSDEAARTAEANERAAREAARTAEANERAAREAARIAEASERALKAERDQLLREIEELRRSQGPTG